MGVIVFGGPGRVRGMIEDMVVVWKLTGRYMREDDACECHYVVALAETLSSAQRSVSFGQCQGRPHKDIVHVRGGRPLMDNVQTKRETTYAKDDRKHDDAVSLFVSCLTVQPKACTDKRVL